MRNIPTWSKGSGMHARGKHSLDGAPSKESPLWMMSVIWQHISECENIWFTLHECLFPLK